jgi:hypothetical protein
VDEVKEIRDKAVAVAAYARQAQDTELESLASGIKLRAERRVGELLGETAARGERQRGHGDQRAESRATTPLPTLADLGITKDQSSRWQAIAKIPEAEFEGYLAAAKATKKPVYAEPLVAAVMRARREGRLRALGHARQGEIPDGDGAPRFSRSGG